MKTPDEIKKALECCFYDSAQCGDCPYYPVNCDRELVRDAREYIRQLEADKIGLLESSHEIRKDMLSRIQQLEAERDALMDEIEQSCDTCKHNDDCKKDKEGCFYCYPNEDEQCECCECFYKCNWEWRGVQKEDCNG